MRTIWQEIKIGRLIVAVAVTLLIADVVPHPNLSPGFLDHTFQRTQGNPAEPALGSMAKLGGPNRAE